MKKILKIVIGSLIGIAILAAFLYAVYHFTYLNSKEYKIDDIALSDSTIEMTTVSSVLIEFKPLTSELTSFYFYPTGVTEETMLTIYYCILDPRTAEIVQMQQVEGLVTPDTYEIKLDFENTEENPMVLEEGKLYNLIIRFNRPYGQQQMSFLSTHSMDGHIVPKYIIDQRKQTGLMCCKFVFANRDEAVRKVFKKIGIIGGILAVLIIFILICKKTCFISSKEYFLSDGPRKISIIRIIGYFLFFLSTFLGQADLTELSIDILVTSLIVIIAGYLIDAIAITRTKSWGKSYTRKYSLQAIVVYVVLLIFIISATLSLTTPKDYIGIISLEYAVLVLGLIFWFVGLGKLRIKEIKKSIINNKELVVIVAIGFLISMTTVFYAPIFDDFEYLYNYTSQLGWDFTMSKSNYMYLCGHLTTGAIIFALIGMFLGSGSFVAVKMVQVVLLTITIVIIYTMINKVTANKKVAIMGSAMFVAYPSVFASQNVNPDYFAVLFVIWLLASYCFDLNILMIFSGFLLCYAKEPLAVLYSGFCVGYYLFKLIKVYTNEKKIVILGCMKLKEYLSLAAPIVSWILIFKAKSIVSYFGTDVGKSITWGTSLRVNEAGVTVAVGSGLGGFGFDPKYFCDVLLQEFVLNYTWIFTSIIIFSIIVCIVKKELWFKKYLYIMVPAMFAFIAGTAINALYVTGNNYRYKVPETVILYIVFVLCLESFNVKERVKKIGAVVVLVLMLVQQFFTSDPLSFATGTIFATGRGLIEELNKGSSLFVHVGSQYNRQGYTYGNFIEKVLNTIEYDENTILYSPGVKANYDYDFYEPIVYVKPYYFYDKETREMNRFSLNGAVGMQVIYGELCENGKGYYYCYADRRQDVENCDRIYLLVQPYERSRMSDDFISNAGYSVVSEQEVSYATWKGTIYELSKN